MRFDFARVLKIIAAAIGVLGVGIGVVVWLEYRNADSGNQSVRDRVRAIEPRMEDAIPNLSEAIDGRPIVIIGVKDEQRLELWKETEPGRLNLLKSYPFAGSSGQAGPKLERGDGQIPEGIYEITSLNPNSFFHLSLRLSFPNEFDRQMAAADGRTDLGDDIFIHGSHATVGCIPIGDDAIEEVFYLIAKNGRKRTTVILTPCDLRLSNSEAPNLDYIGWEEKLYAEIRDKLMSYEFTK